MYSVSPGHPPGHVAHHHHQSSSYSYRTNPMYSNPYMQNNGTRCGPRFSRIRQIMFEKIYKYVWQWSSQYRGMQVERSVRKLAAQLDNTLRSTVNSEMEYLNQEEMFSRVEVMLRHLTQQGQQSQQYNRASTSIIEPTLNMPSLFGECDMSDVIRFPNQMIPENSTAADSNIIPNSMPMCNGTSVTEYEPISELQAHPMPIQEESIGGQNYLMLQSAGFMNSNDFQFDSRDQTVQFPNDSLNSGQRNIYSNMINASSPDMPGATTSGCNEPKQLFIGQLQQGHGNDLCSIAPSILENHNCITSFLPRVQSDSSGNVPDMYTQCHTNSRSSLMAGYFRSPHPEEEMATQPQVNQSGNENYSLPVSDTLGQFRGYDVPLNSQTQPQQNYAAGMIETTTGGYIPDTMLNIVSKEKYVTPETASIGVNTELTLSRDATCTAKDLDVERKIKKARRSILIGLCHAKACALSTAGACPLPNCIKYKNLLHHIVQCRGVSCKPLCSLAKSTITHYRLCKDPGCSICVSVKAYLSNLKKLVGNPTGMNNGQCNANIKSTIETDEDLQHPPKRVKINVPEVCIPTTEKPVNDVFSDCTPHSAESLRYMNSDAQYELAPPGKPELKKLNGSSHEDPSIATHRDSKTDTWASNGKSVEALENDAGESLNHEELLQTSTERASLPAPVTESTEHPKINCAALTEFFTPDQVKQHIISLRQCVSQSNPNADKEQSVEQSMNQTSCQLCAAEELNYEPMPIYCTSCGSRIKTQAVYYILGTGDTRYNFCTKCHTAIPKENSTVYGVTFSKSELEKRENNDYIAEPWVQCDKCQGWQHQICALFNSRLNGEGLAKYTCPNCYVKEIERGDRVAFPQTAFRGAKDLPRTALSDHIERRLGRRLAETERPVDEKVCGDLVVRVVLSVDKKLEVKKNFLEIFQGDDYPSEFPYKSKVILLFQNIEGVEVCLFGMFVQEYGSECDFPNKRRVYISYLDSVKYFRPDVKLMNGERLRTFVYHEVLIGYLEYCKLRGFTSCYIWVCPPPKGDDFILYCHPESQRTPKKDKLREWYLSMLKKAMKENTVVEIGNLYDNFLVPTRESKAKLTAARLPYFDGDYWPGIAEETLQRLSDEGEKASSKKSATKKPLIKRSLRTWLRSDISDRATKDILLMDEIGKKMYPMKEDFIIIHLQHACTHCCMFITSGNCWQCKQCSSFRLCDRCYEAEQWLDDRDRHPLKKSFSHPLHPVKIPDVPPSDTKDVDEIIKSNIFDTRHEFLSFCKGNRYQNDTLRRAKHSSMMLVYHLHNPTATAIVIHCNICHYDLEPGGGLMCDVCFDYGICSTCYEKLGDSTHPHKLTQRYTSHQIMEARSQVKKMNDLIVHVSDCRSPSCMYADCRKVKWLFHHGRQCTERALKGCVTCKKMWYLLRLHSKNCLELKCRVPRCSDLKMHKRRLHRQIEAECQQQDVKADNCDG